MNKKNMYNGNIHLPEIYDQTENWTEDVDFLMGILKRINSPSILEPFCGTGRIVIPLLKKGYQIVGIDLAADMLNHLRSKIKDFNASIQQNVELIEGNVLKLDWPDQFDLVILGSNCLYELAAPDDQQKVIKKAFQSLKPGGFIFIDTDNMEGLLKESWCNIGVEEKIYPSGQCQHGVKMQGYAKPIWVDRAKRLWRAERRIEIEFPDGSKEQISWVQQKHPVSADEIQAWLKDSGFKIIEVFADLAGKKKFKKGARRATFIAKKS